ncbi:MAG: FAD-dependent oxidoreductase [bacterium]|nr:FAD-dependent oxidoreductase [bacterium]
MARDIQDVVVIGGGPAGLAAALYAARGGLSTLVLEPGLAGGQVANVHRVENYPGFPDGVDGAELAARLEQGALRQGAGWLPVPATGVRLEGRVKTIFTADEEIQALAVIVATGAGPRKLGVPGEDRLRGRGVSYCATCDGAFFRDRELVVVGGGNAAVEEALFLTRFARKVSIVHRRDRLRAAEVARRRAEENPRLAWHWNTVVTAIEGGDQVEAVNLLSAGKESRLEVDGVFIYVGADPVTGFLGGQLALDRGGYVLAGEDTTTSLRGVFAAGDVRSKELRQIVTAVADGAAAAIAAEKYLVGEGG